MAGLNFRDADEFDPEAYGGQGAGGLLGRLQAVVQPGQIQPGADSVSPSNGVLEFNPGNYDSPQGGLFGRLLAVQMQQSQFEPGADLNPEQASDHGQTPQTRIIVRPSKAYSPYDPETSALSTGGPSAPQAETSTQPEAIQQNELDQAQQAREAAAEQLARGVRNPTANQGVSLDPIDIAKSAGIGVANGGVNTVGLLGDALTGFGYLPNNFVPNLFRRWDGRPQLPAEEPDYWKSWRSDELRRWIESHTTEFYQPKSRAGRYAETIGEMVPMVIGGEALGAVRGAQSAGTALSELPWALLKHAVAPGTVVQALEEALPDSQLGQTVQKVYPAARRGLPVALVATRYLSRRIASE